MRKINKICTTWQLSTKQKFAIFNTLWLHVFSSPGLDFGICLDGKLHYTKSKASSLVPEGRSKWEVKKMALGMVSSPNRYTHSWSNSECVSVRLPSTNIALLCSRYTSSGHCGWNQDSGQAGETLTWIRVPRQHHRRKGLRGKRACLWNLHHRCCSRL